MSHLKVSDNTPVIVGVADIIDRNKEDGPDPLSFLSHASELAFRDTGIKKIKDYVDSIAVVRFSVDYSTATNQSSFEYDNFPRSLAKRLGVKKDVIELYSGMGGNAPQVLIQEISKKIYENQCNCALISGGEVLHTMISKLKAGRPLNWRDAQGGEPQLIGINKEGFSKMEKVHHMDLPSNVYPLFANSLRASKSQNSEAHLGECAKVFS